MLHRENSAFQSISRQIILLKAQKVIKTTTQPQNRPQLAFLWIVVLGASGLRLPGLLRPEKEHSAPAERAGASYVLDFGRKSSMLRRIRSCSFWSETFNRTGVNPKLMQRSSPHSRRSLWQRNVRRCLLQASCVSTSFTSGDGSP